MTKMWAPKTLLTRALSLQHLAWISILILDSRWIVTPWIWMNLSLFLSHTPPLCLWISPLLCDSDCAKSWFQKLAGPLISGEVLFCGGSNWDLTGRKTVPKNGTWSGKYKSNTGIYRCRENKTKEVPVAVMFQSPDAMNWAVLSVSYVHCVGLDTGTHGFNPKNHVCGFPKEWGLKSLWKREKEKRSFRPRYAQVSCVKRTHSKRQSNYMAGEKNNFINWRKFCSFSEEFRRAQRVQSTQNQVAARGSRAHSRVRVSGVSQRHHHNRRKGLQLGCVLLFGFLSTNTNWIHFPFGCAFANDWTPIIVYTKLKLVSCTKSERFSCTKSRHPCKAPQIWLWITSNSMVMWRHLCKKGCLAMTWLLLEDQLGAVTCHNQLALGFSSQTGHTSVVSLCAYSVDVFIAGRNDSGQLGQGDKDRRDVPTLIETLQDLNIVDAACGRSHTLLLSGRNSKPKFSGCMGKCKFEAVLGVLVLAGIINDHREKKSLTRELGHWLSFHLSLE